MSLTTGCQDKTAFLTIAAAPIITRTLKIAEPTIVPIPIAAWFPGFISAIIATNNSAELDPAAIKVAPAASEERRSLCEMRSRESM